MTKQQFYRSITSDSVDVIALLTQILKDLGTPYCLIGGLAVNAYVDPVISLDIDIVVAAIDTERVAEAAAAKGFKVSKFAHSLNLDHPDADLRVQLQTDPVYQIYIERAVVRNVMGYRLKVAHLHDVFSGKLLAYNDEACRPSERQKDLADIMRLEEQYPELKALRT